MSEAVKDLVGNRYKIVNRIAQGGMSVVYQAFDRLTRRTVALKYIKPHDYISNTTSVDSRLILANEFRLLTSLNHPNVVSVLDYGFDDQKQPYFAMEFLTDSNTIIEVANQETEEGWYDLIIQLLQAVIYLHRRGILHRDLKPENIHVVQEGGQHIVKLVDFGVAQEAGVIDIGGSSSDIVAGSFAYMAPEVINGLNYTEQSDIYALGLIIYEVITGYYAFPYNDVATLLQSILSTTPDLDIPEIDPLIALILERALAIDVNVRYQSVTELLQEFQHATNTNVSENVEIRESYLQSARFVGRENEVETLTNSLDAANDGHGSFWLVGGKSGVGKTRLFGRMRTQAMVQGFLVLHGNAVEGGRKLYAMWYEILRRLILTVELSDLQAQVLKEIVPDIHQMVDRPVDDPPDLEGDDHRIRLATTIIDLFRKIDKPVLLILEDLHWAQEGLLLLQQLSYHVSEMPLLILANYRNDEAPDLPQRFSDFVNSLELHHFSKDDMEELCYAMLGDVYIESSILDLLWKESKGNAFSLVTMIRALTANSGNLSRLENIDFTNETVAGGIQMLIHQQIARLPGEVQHLLQIAAVIGRQIRLEVMQVIEPGHDYEYWLLLCSNAGILERTNDGNWQFEHNKILESIRYELPVPEYRRINRVVAQAFERLFPNDSSNDVFLAHYWHEAQDDAKELFYSLRVSEQMVSTGAYQDALNIARRVQDLLEKLPSSDTERIQSAHIIGEAYYGLGNLSESRKYLELALALLHVPEPASKGHAVRGLIVQIVRQIWHRTILDKLTRSESYIKNKPHWLRVVRIYERLQQIHYFSNNFVRGFFCAISALNIADKLGEHAIEARARNSAGLTVVFGAIRLSIISDMYLRRVNRLLNDNAVDHNAFSACKYYLGVYSSGQTRWNDAIKYYREAIIHAEKAGLQRRLEETKMLLAATLYVSGKMNEALEYTNSVQEIASLQHDLQFQALASATHGEILLRKGDLDHARQLLEHALVQLETLGDTGAVIRVCGLLARLNLRAGNRDESESYVKKLTELLTDSMGLRFGIMEGFIGTAELYLSKWAADVDNQHHKAEANAACQRLENFGKRYKSGRPTAFILRARYFDLARDKAKAKKYIARAITTAKNLQMPYEEACAYYYAGCILIDDKVRQTQSYENALAIFEELGSEWDVERTRKRLGS